MNVKQKIKDSKWVLVWFFIWGLVFWTISYWATWSQGLIWSAFRCIAVWDCSQLVLQESAFATWTINASKVLKDLSISSEKLDTTLSSTISWKADTTYVNSLSWSLNTKLNTKLDKTSINWTYPKVTVTNWSITAWTSLSATDIPALDSSKITSWNFSSTRINAWALTNGMTATTQAPWATNTYLATTKFVTDAVNAATSWVAILKNIPFSVDWYYGSWYNHSSQCVDSWAAVTSPYSIMSVSIPYCQSEDHWWRNATCAASVYNGQIRVCFTNASSWSDRFAANWTMTVLMTK